MFFLTGLPIDREISDETILKSLRSKKLKEIEIIDLPDIPIKHFDSLIAVLDDIKAIDVESTILYNDYSKMMMAYKSDEELVAHSAKIDFLIKTFKWDTNRFKPKFINEIIQDIAKDFRKHKNVFIERSKEHEVQLKESNKALRVLKGNLRDIDIMVEEHEFIYEHHILVCVNNKSNFLEKIKKIKSLSHETLEVVLTDNEYILYRIFGMKSRQKEVKKEILDHGFYYKETFYREEYEARKKHRENTVLEYESQKNNFLIFLNQNIYDFFINFIHIKILKLYADSVLMYGLGKNCFFVCTGKGINKMVKIWRKLAYEWRFSNRICRELEIEENFAYVYIKNPLLKDDDDD